MFFSRAGLGSYSPQVAFVIKCDVTILSVPTTDTLLDITDFRPACVQPNWWLRTWGESLCIRLVSLLGPSPGPHLIDPRHTKSMRPPRCSGFTFMLPGRKVTQEDTKATVGPFYLLLSNVALNYLLLNTWKLSIHIWSGFIVVFSSKVTLVPDILSWPEVEVFIGFLVIINVVLATDLPSVT